MLSSQVPSSPRRSIEGKMTVPRSPRSTSSLPSTAILKTEAATAKSTESSRRVPLHKGPSSHSQQRHKTESNDGDVSSLISSDSESDDDVLLPSFKSTGSSAHLPPPLHQHQLGSKAANHRPSSSGSVSGYASSPPASPVSTVSSSSSSFSLSSASINARQRMRAARPRSSSNVSSTSTNVLSGSSDSEDPAFDSSSYYSDRPSSASSASYGLRRRVAAQNLAVTTSSPAAMGMSSRDNEWLECFDPATGSVYYYNQRTGESQWER